MNLDILLGVVAALMATLGGIVSAHAPSKKWHKVVYGGVFFILGVSSIVLIVAQSRAAERAQEDARERQRQLQSKLDTSLLSQEYMRGQLDSITTMVKRVGERTTDPVVGQMAGAIIKMADNARAATPSSSGSDPRLEILYDKGELDGRTITVPVTPMPQTIQLAEFHIKNIGGHVTGSVTARIYFSKSISPKGDIWLPTASDEPRFQSACYSSIPGGPIAINPQETWNWPAFSGEITQGLNEPVSVRLKIFYGAAKPAEANFIIRKQE